MSTKGPSAVHSKISDLIRCGKWEMACKFITLVSLKLHRLTRYEEMIKYPDMKGLHTFLLFYISGEKNWK
jgi:hypothetical protein